MIGRCRGFHPLARLVHIELHPIEPGSRSFGNSMSALSISSTSSTGCTSLSNASHKRPSRCSSRCRAPSHRRAASQRRRETASYSYKPCCAFVVDLMCQRYSVLPSEAVRLLRRAASCPVPGSPFTSSGRPSVTAAFTAIIKVFRRDVIFRTGKARGHRKLRRAVQQRRAGSRRDPRTRKPTKRRRSPARI